MSYLTDHSTAIAKRQSAWEQRARVASARAGRGQQVDIGQAISNSRMANSFSLRSGQSQQRQADAYTAFRQWVYVATSWVARRIAGQPWLAGNLQNAPKNPNDRKLVGGIRMAQPWLASKAPRFLNHKAVSDEQLEVMASHPVLDCLAKPNAIQRKFEFLYLSAVSIQITGVAYWIGGVVEDKDAPGGERLEMWAVPSNYIVPDHSEGLFSKYFLKLPGEHEGTPLDPGTVTRTYYADPTDMTAVYPPIAACWSAVRTDEFIQRSQEQLFERGMTPRIGLVVGKDDATGRRPTLLGPQRRALIRAVREVWDQTVRYGDPAILDGLIEDVKQLDRNSKEMDWINSGKVTKDRVFQTFGVHPFVVGDQQTRTKAEAIVAEQVTCSNSVNPLIDSFSQTATGWIGPMYEKPKRLILWIETAKPDDEELKLSKWNAAVGNGSVGPDEYRSEVLGLPPIEPEEPEPVLRTDATALSTTVQILTAVGDGKIQRESAVELLVEMGVDKKRAKAIVGKEPPEPPAPDPAQVPPVPGQDPNANPGENDAETPASDEEVDPEAEEGDEDATDGEPGAKGGKGAKLYDPVAGQAADTDADTSDPESKKKGGGSSGVAADPGGAGGNVQEPGRRLIERRGGLGITRKQVHDLHLKRHDINEKRMAAALQLYFAGVVKSTCDAIAKLGGEAGGDPEKAAAKLLKRAWDGDQHLEDLVKTINPHMTAAFFDGALTEYELGKRAKKAIEERLSTKVAKDPSYDPAHADECCPHCGARQERGDNGKCNRCGKPWPEKSAAVATKSTASDIIEEMGIDWPEAFGTEPPAWLIAEATDTMIAAFEQPYWQEIVEGTRDDLLASLQQTIREGIPLRQLANEVMAIRGPDYAAWRARNTARTETTNMLAAGHVSGIRETARQTGLEMGKEWNSVFGSTSRDDHMAADAQERELDATFEIGSEQARWPGDDRLSARNRCNCQCYRGDQPVSGAFISGARMLYHGPLVEVVTLSGARLNVTPNHPVLTPHGFRAAGDLKNGEYLVRVRDDALRLASLSLGDNEEDKPSLIEDVFESIRSASEGVERTAGLPLQFHGDARFAVGEVEVVSANPKLPLEGIRENGEEIHLGSRAGLMGGFHKPVDVRRAGPLPSLGLRIGVGAKIHALLLETLSDDDAADPVFRGKLDLCRSLQVFIDDLDRGNVDSLFAGVASHGFAVASHNDADRLKPAVDCHASDAVDRTYFDKRHPSVVELDQVIGIREYDYLGHVYDLQTVAGWYIADGIVSHNCFILSTLVASELAPDRPPAETAAGDVRVKSFGDGVILDAVPDVRQPNGYWCGPAAAMAVGAYFDRGPDNLEAWAKALGTTEEKSTSPEAIVEYLTSLGLVAEGRSGMSIEDLNAAVTAGCPVLCPVQDYTGKRSPKAAWEYGHWLVIIGRVPDHLVVQDSSLSNLQCEPGGSVPDGDAEESGNIGAQGRKLVRDEEWLAAWHDVGEDGAKYERYGIVVSDTEGGIGEKSLDAAFKEVERLTKKRAAKHPEGDAKSAEPASAADAVIGALTKALRDGCQNCQPRDPHDDVLDLLRRNYNPNQPRARDGKWSHVGGGGKIDPIVGTGDVVPKVKPQPKLLPTNSVVDVSKWAAHNSSAQCYVKKIAAMEAAAKAGERYGYLGDPEIVTAIFQNLSQEFFEALDGTKGVDVEQLITELAAPAAVIFLGGDTNYGAVRGWNKPGAIDEFVAKWCGVDEQHPRLRITGGIAAMLSELIEVTEYASQDGVLEEQWQPQVEEIFQRYVAIFMGISPAVLAMA